MEYLIEAKANIIRESVFQASQHRYRKHTRLVPFQKGKSSEPWTSGMRASNLKPVNQKATASTIPCTSNAMNSELPDYKSQLYIHAPSYSHLTSH